MGSVTDIKAKTEHQLDVSNAVALVCAAFPEADAMLGAARLGAVVGLVVTYMENATEARAQERHTAYPCDAVGCTPFCTHPPKEKS